MRILLIGEVSGGEGTFVRNLISYPPPDVRYFYILSSGENYIRDCQSCVFLENMVNILRRTVIGAGMRIKIVKIGSKDCYDIIHLHGIATKIIAKKVVPIVFSASGNMWQGFRDFYKWPKHKLYKAFYGTKILYKTLGITDRIHNYTKK